MSDERVVTFDCGGDRLLGILHAPEFPSSDLGILVVVGGPQYRVGSHRQFVLMARQWAIAGFAVFRFDYRGMGDSGGGRRTFESVGDDIHAAIGAFMREQPSLGGVVIFGLCDAASAALMYSTEDARVRGLILANPWVRTLKGEARSYVRHYYGARLLQRSFWRKIFSGEFRLVDSLRSLLNSLFLARVQRRPKVAPGGGRFIDRMRVGLATAPWFMLILVSEHDLTASEFADLCADDPDWREASSRSGVVLHTIYGADHTFSSRGALDKALKTSIAWLAERKTKRS